MKIYTDDRLVPYKKDIIIPRLSSISEIQALPSEDQMREEEKRMVRKIIDIPRKNGD